MKEYLILENGQTVEALDEKNREIKLSLQDTINKFKTEERLDRRGTKKFGYRLLTQIENVLGKYERMSTEKFVSLTSEDIENMWWHFHSIIAHFNLYFELVPNRQTFMLYCGINLNQYKQLKNSQNKEISSIIEFIEDRLVGNGYSAGENGNANSTAIMNRLKSADVGHNVVSASEDKFIKAVEQKTPLELEKEINQLLGGDIKLLK